MVPKSWWFYQMFWQSNMKYIDKMQEKSDKFINYTKLIDKKGAKLSGKLCQIFWKTVGAHW